MFFVHLYKKWGFLPVRLRLNNWFQLFFLFQQFLRVNGAVSVNENMADWQGFNMALMAYKKYSKKHKAEQKLPDDTLKKLTPEQLFSFAFSYVNILHKFRGQFFFLPSLRWENGGLFIRRNFFFIIHFHILGIGAILKYIKFFFFNQNAYKSWSGIIELLRF